MSTASEFPIYSCPSIVRQMADDYSDILGGHYKAFVGVLCGFVLGIGSFSNIFRFLLFSTSVSAMSRFFDDEGSLWEKLNRRYRRRLLRLMPMILKDPDRFMWAIDDTLVARSGKRIYGSYYWHDHNTKGTVWGHRLMVVGIVDRKRKVLIPVYWEILHREDKLSSKMPHEKGWQVALKLLKSSVREGFPRLLVVADSWFAGEEFFESLELERFQFVFEVKSNRNVAQHGRSIILKSRVDEFFEYRSRHKIFYQGIDQFISIAI